MFREPDQNQCAAIIAGFLDVCWPLVHILGYRIGALGLGGGMGRGASGCMHPCLAPPGSAQQ